MKIGTKKAIVCMILINYIIAASCPNMCSGHGSCGKGGICSCFPGWLEGDCSARSCPYGHGYVDPTEAPGAYASLANRASLECSGQGTCDRTAGTCKCFPGYEGVSCDRLSCPNNCNGHGVCTAVKMLDLNEDSHSGSYYETDLSKIKKGTYANSNYDGWDADQSYVCVCDGEYRGFDCSEKKCPTGYVENSDCDSPAKSTQTITITQDGTPAAKSCMAYLEYTDQYNRIWYSDAFCVTCKDRKDQDASTGGDCGKTGDGEGNELIYGWTEALLSLPVGVIDVSENDIDVSVTVAGAHIITTKITFGNQQTGKQNPIRIITDKNLDNSDGNAATSPGKEWCGDCGSGYHGMTRDQLYLKTTAADGGAPAKVEPVSPSDPNVNNANYKALVSTVNPVVATVDGIPPLECSRNGICQRDTGLCSCFEGYYGNACTEQASML